MRRRRLFRKMQKVSLLKIRDKILPVLEKHGVIRAAIFGSLAKGKGRENSDLDIVIEFKEGKSLLDLVALKLNWRIF